MRARAGLRVAHAELDPGGGGAPLGALVADADGPARRAGRARARNPDPPVDGRDDRRRGVRVAAAGRSRSTSGEGAAQGADRPRGRAGRGRRGDHAAHAARARAACAVYDARGMPAGATGRPRLPARARHRRANGRSSWTSRGTPGDRSSSPRSPSACSSGRSRRGGDFAELYAEDAPAASGSRSTTGAWSAPRAGASAAPACAWCRATRPTTATSTALPSSDLLRVADSVVAGAARRARASRARLAAAPSRRRCTPSRSAPRRSPRRARPTLLRACDERARGAGAEIAQVAHRLRRVAPAGRGVQLRGLRAADDRTRVRLGVAGGGPRDGRVETGSETRGGHAGFELIEDRPEQVAESAARKALTMLDAVDAPDRPAARGGRATASAACCCTRRSATGSRPTPSRSAPASTPASSASSSPSRS